LSNVRVPLVVIGMRCDGDDHTLDAKPEKRTILAGVEDRRLAAMWWK